MQARLIRQIDLLEPAQRRSDVIVGMIADFFMQLGKTSLAKYQLSSVIRTYLGGSLDVSPQDLDALERMIRQKETGVSGSNSKAIADRVRMKNAGKSGNITPVSIGTSSRANMVGIANTIETGMNRRNGAMTLEDAMRGNE